MKRLKFILIPPLSGVFAIAIYTPVGHASSFVLPSFSPPLYLLFLIWTACLFLMGLSSSMISDINRRYLFYLVLAAVFLWPVILFSLNNILPAFLLSVLIILLITDLALSFGEENIKASLILIPVIIWAVFCSCTNLAVFLLN